VRVCKHIQVHQVGNLLSLIYFSLTSPLSSNSSSWCVCYFSLCLSLSLASLLFYSQGTINLRGSMKELLLEQQLGTLNRFRSGTLRRCHHRMTDRQIDDIKKKRNRKRRYLIVILILVWCFKLLTHLFTLFFYTIQVILKTII
jgi:hypothetical protein